MARALYRRAGAGAYVSYSRSCALADLADSVARARSYILHRGAHAFHRRARSRSYICYR